MDRYSFSYVQSESDTLSPTQSDISDFILNKCQIHYINSDILRQSDRHEMNKSEKTDCPCGGTFRWSDKSKHCKTKKHMAYEATLAPHVEIIEDIVPTTSKVVPTTSKVVPIITAVAPVLTEPVSVPQASSVNVYDPVAVIMMMVGGLNCSDLERLKKALMIPETTTVPVIIQEKEVKYDEYNDYSDSVVWATTEDDKDENKDIGIEFLLPTTPDASNVCSSSGGTFRKFHMDIRDIDSVEDKRAYREYTKDHNIWRKSEQRRVMDDYQCGIEDKPLTKKQEKAWELKEKKALENDAKEDEDSALYKELLDRDFKDENEIDVYLNEREISGSELSKEDREEYKKTALYNLKNGISRF
jgi:hypothetical protein